MCVCVCVCTHVCSCSQRPEEGARPLKLELQSLVWMDSSPLEGQQVLFTAEPSLQLPKAAFVKHFFPSPPLWTLGLHHRSVE